jgi:hypothetical protein
MKISYVFIVLWSKKSGAFIVVTDGLLYLDSMKIHTHN